MKKLFFLLRYWIILAIWKRRARKRRRPHISIGNVKDFFKQLNSSGVSYMVMRYFDEIPLTKEDELKMASSDIDILADAQHLVAICKAVASHPGKVKVDLRSNRLLLGTDVQRYTYYTPAISKELLDHRILSKDDIYRPDDKRYLYSLAYYAVYHRGLDTGIPSGLPGMPPPNSNPKHDIASILSEFSEKAGEKLPAELTLFALHEWLKERDWSMPYDLLPRWPKRTPVLDALFQHETEILKKDLGEIRGICVYLLREDAIKAGISEKIIEALKEQYLISDTFSLSPEQQQRVMRQTRGGDWSKRKKIRLYLPELAVVCKGKIALPFSAEEGGEDTDNPNIAFKRALRDKLRKDYPEAADFVHGSDNDLEAMAYIKAIYGTGCSEKINDLFRNAE